MDSQWRAVKVSDVAKLIYRYPSFYGFNRPPSGIPVIRGEHLIENGEICSDPKEYWFVSKEDSDNFPKTILEKHDIVMAVRGTVGKFSRVRKSHAGYQISPNTIRISPDPEKIDPSYMFFALQHRHVSSFLLGSVATSAVPGIRAKDINEAPLLLPSMKEQVLIADFLSLIYDKIKLLKEANEALDAVAKVLFKSWFMDFDPVRAKVEGRPTGLPDEINELFPDSFEESELGEIPNGWSVASIKDQSSYLSRGISPKYCESDEGVVVLNQKCIRGGAIDFSKSRRHDPAKKKIAGREISRFDCLVNSTGVGTLGRVAIVPELTFGDVIVDSHVTVVRGRSEHSTFYLTNTLLNRQLEIEALGEGSTGQTELSRAVLGEMAIVVPPEGLLNAFYSSTVCLFEKRWLNEATSVTLSSLRDALLPRLISGELRVPDAEKMLEEVGI
ncbi:hypothetical protein KR52_11055 [Synechococcus sp. KORDI-52]|uniref:restriction endonuclease subunit S n=1 Tax=Synechococcus sp. KORDI-52 TaxID=585425 RepID=UPI0004E0748A|nr:restriction endonuclease subunit S [Synechococcus sp. KORDI-52]AII49675.1 hypothetical protein KR52_11055 [Synechococcus sp. KORDI-52]